jgi:hypothetical protein
LSSSAITDSSKTLGIAEASLALGLTGTQTALWNGQLVDATSVLVSYKTIGDANLSGKIDADDYFLIDTNYNKPATAAAYAKGDFNFDGKVNGDDYFEIDQRYPAQTIAAPAALSGPWLPLKKKTTFLQTSSDSSEGLL